MAENASRRGATDLGMPLMILAFAVIGGFMYWLNGQAAAERALRIVEDTVEADEGVYMGTAATIDPVNLQRDAAPYEGQEVRVVDLSVASMLGTQGFWLQLPNGNPFLVSKSAALMAESPAVTPGELATVIGRVMTINDSVLSSWSGAGTIGDGDRLAAEFATHFIEATEVHVSPAPPSGGEGGGQ